MAKTEVRKVYERPALTEIGSMTEKTETWGNYWQWKWWLINHLKEKDGWGDKPEFS